MQKLGSWGKKIKHCRD